MALLGGLMLGSREAAALRVTVKGTASIEGRLEPDGDAQILRGKLRDDLGAPVGRASVSADILLPDGRPLLTLPVARACPGSASPQMAPDAYRVTTDAQGAFCLRAQGLPTRGTLRLRFAGQPGLATAAAEVPFDGEPGAPSLAWDPRPEVIDLDASNIRIAVAAGGGRNRPENLSMELLDERGKVLGQALTDDRGRALFEVATAALGGPGPGELVARVRGPGGQAPLKTTVVRSARVSVVGTAPGEPIVPHDGHKFVLAATTQRGPAEGGVVEARIGNEIVGVGAVKKGQAVVETTFDVPGDGALDIMFSYLSSAPELRPGDGLLLRVPVRPPSPLRKAPLVLAGVLLIGWLARGWRRPARVARENEPDAKPALGPLPPLVVEEDGGSEGWRGTVLDAHDRRPLAGVVVRVVSRDFYGEREVGSMATDAQGHFELSGPWEATRALLVDAPWHSHLERPLPRPGRLTLALVSRRRSLLDRLVNAARRLGVDAPGGEPTPAQVARGFEAQSRDGGVRWARAVEEVAFGASAVGADEEKRVAGLEDDLARGEGSDRLRR